MPAQTKTAIARPAPHNLIVQMFDRVAIDADVVAAIPAGSKVTVLESAIEITVGGMKMRFYKVRYKKWAGYVNARWLIMEG